MINILPWFGEAYLDDYIPNCSVNRYDGKSEIRLCPTFELEHKKVCDLAKILWLKLNFSMFIFVLKLPTLVCRFAIEARAARATTYNATRTQLTWNKMFYKMYCKDHIDHLINIKFILRFKRGISLVKYPKYPK